jgi:hypothetical protein
VLLLLLLTSAWAGASPSCSHQPLLLRLSPHAPTVAIEQPAQHALWGWPLLLLCLLIPLQRVLGILLLLLLRVLVKLLLLILLHHAMALLQLQLRMCMPVLRIQRLLLQRRQQFKPLLLLLVLLLLLLVRQRWLLPKLTAAATCRKAKGLGAVLPIARPAKT